MAWASAPPTLMLLTRSMTSPSRCLSQGVPPVVLGEDTSEIRIVSLDGSHRLVDCGPIGLLPGLGLDGGPSGFLGDPKHVAGGVVVSLLRVHSLVDFGFQFLVEFLEGIGDVLEEDEGEDDVLVFCGVDVASEGIGSSPEL